MKTIIATVLVLGTIGCLVAMQTPQSDEITALKKQIADLSLRASRLEHASGATPGAVDKSHGNASPDNIPRSMIVAGMNTGRPRPLDQDQVDDLKDDADSLQHTANFHMDNEARVSSGMYYVGGYYSDGHYGYNHSHDGRQHAEMAQREMATRYATLAANKRSKAKRLEAAANQPHQILNGHDGDVIFTLRTAQNLSLDLENISIGDTVTWGGHRVSADSTSEVWEISSIRKAH